jgi:perosamine synthetase
MMHFGLIPVMVDCDTYGQIDPELIEQAITDQTRSVIVTHMWGYSADIERIREICDAHKLLLIEDCSHAHGATFDGQPLGSFGDISVWSLQGQKIITGGEGGIMLFKDKKHFERAVLYGHYNKRCKQQIEDEILKEYSLTGAGLKLRASTLSVAMARHYFSQLDIINAEKTQNASRLSANIKLIDGIRLLEPRPNSTNSWYAQNIMYDETTVSVSRRRFVEALHAEGLIEFDIPGSTGLINHEPLFNSPDVIFPSLYGSPLYNKRAHIRKGR